MGIILSLKIYMIVYQAVYHSNNTLKFRLQINRFLFINSESDDTMKIPHQCTGGEYMNYYFSLFLFRLKIYAVLFFCFHLDKE